MQLCDLKYASHYNIEVAFSSPGTNNNNVGHIIIKMM